MKRRFTLKDDSDEGTGREVTGWVEYGNGALAIHFDGYEDAVSKPKHSVQIMVECWEDQLRAVVWADKDVEDATHIIDLEGARAAAPDPVGGAQ